MQAIGTLIAECDVPAYMTLSPHMFFLLAQKIALTDWDNTVRFALSDSLLKEP